MFWKRCHACEMGILISSLILKIRTSRSFLFKQFTHTTKRIVAHCVMGGRKGELHCIIICHLPLSLYLKGRPRILYFGVCRWHPGASQVGIYVSTSITHGSVIQDCSFEHPFEMNSRICFVASACFKHVTCIYQFLGQCCEVSDHLSCWGSEN